MLDIVVAVVDHTIVHVCRVVSVIESCTEVFQLTEHTVGILCSGNQFTAHFSLIEVLVGKLLHSLCNTECIEDRVGL